MRLKAMMLSALAALALSAVVASSASAGTVVTGIPNQTFHTVQTPTGPMEVPDVLHGTGTADGQPYEWSVSPCARAGEAQYSAYTQAEIEADPDRWCFRRPGSILTGGLKSTASKKAKKKNGARKARSDR